MKREWCSFCRQNLDWKHGEMPVSFSKLGVFSCGRRQCLRYMHAFYNELQGNYNHYYGRFRSYPPPTKQYKKEFDMDGKAE
jgi:hypothetical protein